MKVSAQVPVARLLFALALVLASTLALARGGLPGNNPTLNGGITCSAYLGLGDVQPGATMYVGMRAYTLAKALAGAKVFNIRRASDGATEDVNLACNGLPNTGQTIPFCVGTSCTITEFYDQTGNGWDSSISVVANQGTLTLVCANGNPCVGPSVGYASAAANLTFNAPNTLWVVENSFNSANASDNMIACNSGGGVTEQLYAKNFGGITNTFVAQTSTSGSNIQAGTAVSGVFQDKLGVINGATSSLYVNGAGAVTGVVGAANCTGATGNFLVGGTAASSSSLLEAAAYASDVSGSYAAMRANARTIWNY